MVKLTEIELNEFCDNVLNELYSEDLIEANEHDENFDMYKISVARMMSDGYVKKVIEFEDRRSFVFSMTLLGISFIALGGYSERYKKEVIKDKKERKRYLTTTIIAIIAAIVAILALLGQLGILIFL